MWEGLHQGAAAPAPRTREAECDGHGMRCAWGALGSRRELLPLPGTVCPRAAGKGLCWLSSSECDTRLTSAVFYRSCRNWPPSTPTWSSSRSVGDTAGAQGCLPGLPALPARRPPPSLVQGSVPALCLLADTEGSGRSPPHLASAEVTDPASIKAAAASVGERLKGSGLNLLINNAGIVRPNTLDNETLKDMAEVYMTNTIAPLLLSQVMCSPTAPGTSLYCIPEALNAGRMGPVGQSPPLLSPC